MSEAVTRVMEPLEDVVERVNVQAVFGEPVQEEGVTIIPVAEISVMFGYGYGFGESPGGEEAAGANEGGGGGGGARGRAKPRGYVRITDEGVSFEPIFAPNAVPLAGIALSAWSVFWIGKTIRTIAGVFAKR